MAEKLDEAVLTGALNELPAWRRQAEGNAISREFSFKNFVDAFGFMTRVALLAQKLDHHPDWSNGYNKVSITLSTHSAGGISDLDIALAREIDKLVA